MTHLTARAIARTAAATVAALAMLGAVHSQAGAKTIPGDITIARPNMQDHTFAGALNANLSRAWMNADPCTAIANNLKQMSLPWGGLKEYFYDLSCTMSDGAALYDISPGPNGTVKLSFGVSWDTIDTSATIGDMASNPANPHFHIIFNTSVIVTLAVSNGSVVVQSVTPAIFGIACSVTNETYYNKPYATSICNRDWVGDLNVGLSQSSFASLVNSMPSMGIMNAFATSSRQTGYPVIGLSVNNQQLIESARPIMLSPNLHLTPAAVTTPSPVMNHIVPLPPGAITSPSPAPTK